MADARRYVLKLWLKQRGGIGRERVNLHGPSPAM